MALTNADCRDGKTNGKEVSSGSSVSSYDIFDGEGYHKVVNKTINDIDFRLYGRLHSYSEANDTISMTMYLFARKSSSSKSSYNKNKYSTIEFSCGGKTVTFTSGTQGIRVEQATGVVRCLGYKEIANIPLTTGSKTFKAIWYGIDGTDYAAGTYTISETMYWNKNNSSDTAPAITVSGITTSGCTAKVSPLRPDRNCYTTWVWNRKNTTTGADWTDGAAYTVGYNSDSTSHTQEYSGMSAGNSYTLKFTCYLRNYNGLKGTSTRKAPIWSVTKSVTLNKNTGYLTLSNSSKTLTYPTTGTVTINTAHSMDAISSSIDDETVCTRSRNIDGDGKTITLTPKKAGTCTLTVNCAATTGYTAASKTVSITVNRGTGSTTLNPSSLTLTYGGGTKTSTVSYKGAAPTISSAPSSSIATASISGSTVTVTPKGAGSTSLKVNSAQTGQYTADDATLSITVNPIDPGLAWTPPTVKYGGGAKTSTATRNGSGAFSISTSSTTYFTASISTAGVVTITPKAVGSADVTVKCAASGNYTADSVTKTVTVSKGDGNTTLNPTSLTVTMGAGSKTSTVSYKGAAPTISSAPNSAYATASISGSTVTVNPLHVGSTSLTVNSAANTNYTADSATLSITVAQGQGTLTLDGTAGNISKTFTWGASNATVAVAGVGGTVSVSSNNTSVCAASISGSTITLNPENAGTATITVTRAANTDYKAISRTISVTVNRANITLPTGATRTYNGSVQNFTDSSTTYMSLSGNTATNAGSYTATVTPDSNHKWSDTGGTGARTVAWTINKAPGYATWSAANQSLKETQTYTASVSNVHTNGVLKLKSNSDSSVASCTINGANANIVATKLGTTTITLYVDTSNNYTASGDKSFTITVRPAEVKLGSTTAPVYLGSTPVRRIYLGDKIVIF